MVVLTLGRLVIWNLLYCHCDPSADISSLSPTARSLTCVHQGCAGAFTGRWAHRNPMRHLKQKHQSHSSLGAAERYENAVLPCRHNECTRTYAREGKHSFVINCCPPTDNV
ncbi:hypothetical protein BDV96DRAFT_374724 [Lophiotrema nucula]|uniref:C2H2-type domain-containing protein n=1 Tax=Lophiotrema nucula TaxID=690887 RepID=A0A6A5YDL9_9PLEO|nr:hypothetical protein BDV96DRAFT_374724 [Lophiotrema nucula]